jgi:hypothetical protein
MECQNKPAMTGQDAVIVELAHSQLAEITGGTLWVSDGYCVSPFLPRHLPLAALPEQITQIKEQPAIGSATLGAGAGK